MTQGDFSVTMTAWGKLRVLQTLIPINHHQSEILRKSLVLKSLLLFRNACFQIYFKTMDLFLWLMLF